MQNFTKVLGAAPNIQYQGVTDNTNTPDLNNLQNAVFVGKFRRGRLDRIFPVTSDTVEQRLGADIRNPAYTAIVDALGLGIPQVMVQRIRGANLEVILIDTSTRTLTNGTTRTLTNGNMRTLA